MSDAVMVRAEGLSKRYGATDALRDFSLEVRRGEILALVGPNEAGKTTALKLLVGLLTPTAGRASVAGFDVQQNALEVRQRLAFLPDQPFLYEQLTVGETLAFVGGLYRLAPSALRDRATDLVGQFGLSWHLRDRVGQLSFGMRSRLVLVMSLVHHPEVLIMDEPFFGLDPQTLRLIKTLLAARARQGMTVVLSTHQLPVVEDVAHRIAILDRGRLIALGTLNGLQQQHGTARLEELFFQLTTNRLG